MIKRCGIFLVALMILRIATPSLAQEARAPDELLCLFDQQAWEGYRIADWAMIDQDERAYALAILQKNGQNTLCILDKTAAGRWRISGVNARILRPGDLQTDDPLIGGNSAALWVSYSTPTSAWRSGWAESYNFARGEDDTWQLIRYTGYDSGSDLQLSMHRNGDQFELRGENALAMIEASAASVPSLAFSAIDADALRRDILHALLQQNDLPVLSPSAPPCVLPTPCP